MVLQPTALKGWVFGGDMFGVGDRVVCVKSFRDVGPPRRDVIDYGRALEQPVVGGVYTVREIARNPYNRLKIGLALEEVRDARVIGGYWFWDAAHFRKSKDEKFEEPRRVEIREPVDA